MTKLHGACSCAMGRPCVGEVAPRRICQLPTMEGCLGRDPRVESTTVRLVAFAESFLLRPQSLNI